MQVALGVEQAGAAWQGSTRQLVTGSGAMGLVGGHLPAICTASRWVHWPLQAGGSSMGSGCQKAFKKR